MKIKFTGVCFAAWLAIYLFALAAGNDIGAIIATVWMAAIYTKY